MKKIVVLGATGGTGKEVVKQALERGYEVSAIVRNPAAFDMRHKNLNIIRGDVLQMPGFEHELLGKDAVISCLGTQSTGPTKIYSEGIQHIIAAMNKSGVSRLMCISAGALYTSNAMGVFVKMLTKVLQRVFRNMYADMRLMETIVANSNTDWTVIRPPMLKNKAFTGTYRTAVNAHIRRPFSIARADLAHYMLNIINDPATFRAIAEISY